MVEDHTDPKPPTHDGDSHTPEVSWPTVCGTGHRELKPQVYGGEVWRWVHGELERVLVKLRDHCRTTTVVSGMARGFDLELFDIAHATAGLAAHALRVKIR